jgi:WD40 repeat protein
VSSVSLRILARISSAIWVARLIPFRFSVTSVTTSGVDGTFRLWAASGATLARYPSYVGPLATEASGGDFGTPSVGFSPDGRSVAVPASGGIVRVWRIQSLDELLQLTCDWLTDSFTSHPAAPGVCSH